MSVPVVFFMQVMYTAAVMLSRAILWFYEMRNPYWQPDDGRSDQRPIVKCAGCGTLTSCYRGPLLRTVTNERGVWEMYRWICTTCFALTVAEALAQAEET